jgi:hypothetical protein
MGIYGFLTYVLFCITSNPCHLPEKKLSQKFNFTSGFRFTAPGKGRGGKEDITRAP